MGNKPTSRMRGSVVRFSEPTADRIMPSNHDGTPPDPFYYQEHSAEWKDILNNAGLTDSLLKTPEIKHLVLTTVMEMITDSKRPSPDLVVLPDISHLSVSVEVASIRLKEAYQEYCSQLQSAETPL